jgi:HAD superfamily hydrolase (TIGR01493 family)
VTDPRYRAVLLDFRGILVGFPDDDWWIDRAFAAVGRSPRPHEREQVKLAYPRIRGLPNFAQDEARVDTSFDLNREITIRRMTSVGIAEDLAEAMWRLDCQPDAWPIYPDAPAVVRRIKQAGVKTALVSDFHVDVRPHLDANGIVLDTYVISFEHGFQKPDPRMFSTALEALSVEPGEALMVGDRASHDGGAADVGIDTLILPAPATFGARGLDVVLGLL